ncbi:hypothetical protein PanWU01x14_304700 [Parasponia andersonii]|uniref:Uncharacterized protein n=1 Tax=Parasponia andersonii TaxID=3476 RepID=A0A2P5ASJ0_PARAD|nr:hypothetical protein PanWU01x14_304700 [Parasponia andersonii]
MSNSTSTISAVELLSLLFITSPELQGGETRVA